jgi:hypothetical protein
MNYKMENQMTVSKRGCLKVAMLWSVAGLFMAVAVDSKAGLLDHEVVISQAQIQQRVDAMSPMKIERLHFMITLPNPKVGLLKDGPQIEVATDVRVEPPAVLAAAAKLPASWPGQMRARGKIRYEASTGSFYIDEPKVVELDMERVPEKYKPKALELAQLAASKYLGSRPVFVLKDDVLKQRLAKAVLKSVTLRGDTLIVVVGF